MAENQDKPKEPEPEPKPEPKTENVYKYRGQDLGKDVVDGIIDDWVLAQQTKTEPEPEPKPEKKGDDEEVKGLREKVDKLETRIRGTEATNKLLRDLNDLCSDSDFVKNNPELLKDVQEDVVNRVVANPNVPVQQHFERVIKKTEKAQKVRQEKYVKEKLRDEEGTKGEASKGTMEALLPGETPKAEDVRSGKAKEMLRKALIGAQKE